jgi:probable rRNA maturation factor
MPLSDQRRSRLTVSVVDARGRATPAPGLGAWLAVVAPRRVAGEVTVALVPDSRVRALNRTYRGIDAATDVLSFPATSPARRGRPSRPSRRGRLESRGAAVARGPLLGDIVIARGVARRQARDRGHDEATEWRVLALHGLLHLLGYDHDGDRGRMARVEERLRRVGGLPGGLIERELTR